MLRCPRSCLNLRLPISLLKSIIYSSSPSSAVTAPLLVSLRRSCARSVRPLVAFSTVAFSDEPARPTVADSMAATAVEHVVLFKAKDGTDPDKLAAMVSNLRSLSALDGVLHLAAGPVLRHRSSAAAALGFTHLLHSRYRTKEDLAAYSSHPAHVSVVQQHVLPNCDDIMAVDWVGELGSGPVAPQPGSAARVTLVKLAVAVEEAGKGEVLAALDELRVFVPGAMDQLSSGENFSPARAKGYSVGSIAVFSSPGELDGLEAKGGDLMAAQKEKVRPAQKEKVRPLVESVIVVDFIVSPPPAATSGL